jgi:hypothetical protein
MLHNQEENNMDEEAARTLLRENGYYQALLVPLCMVWPAGLKFKYTGLHTGAYAAFKPLERAGHVEMVVLAAYRLSVRLAGELGLPEAKVPIPGDWITYVLDAEGKLVSNA